MELICLFLAVSAPLQVSVSLGQNPTLGQPYTLTCNVSVASGFGIPTVQWMGPGSSTPISTGGDFTVSSTSPYTLTINPLRQSHAGQYTCEATVQNVTITASESLAVDGMTVLAKFIGKDMRCLCLLFHKICSTIYCTHFFPQFLKSQW